MSESVSIIIPVYDEAENLPILYKSIKEVMGRLENSYEIIFVDDGSRDASLERLEEIQATDDNVVVVVFRRNFGQTAALAAGFDMAKGDILITMDADLQNDPQDIPMLLEKIQTADVVSGWRRRRKDPFLSRRLHAGQHELLVKSHQFPNQTLRSRRIHSPQECAVMGPCVVVTPLPASDSQLHNHLYPIINRDRFREFPRAFHFDQSVMAHNAVRTCAKPLMNRVDPKPCWLDEPASLALVGRNRVILEFLSPCHVFVFAFLGRSHDLAPRLLPRRVRAQPKASGSDGCRDLPLAGFEPLQRTLFMRL